MTQCPVSHRFVQGSITRRSDDAADARPLDQTAVSALNAPALLKFARHGVTRRHRDDSHAALLSDQPSVLSEGSYRLLFSNSNGPEPHPRSIPPSAVLSVIMLLEWPACWAKLLKPPSVQCSSGSWQAAAVVELAIEFPKSVERGLAKALGKTTER